MPSSHRHFEYFGDSSEKAEVQDATDEDNTAHIDNA